MTAAAEWFARGDGPASAEWFIRSTSGADTWGARSAGSVSAATWSERYERTLSLSESVRPYVTEGEVTDIDLEVYDFVRPAVLDVANPRLSRGVSDTVRPRTTDAIGAIQKSGTFARAASDTITAVLTEGRSYAVALDVADTITPIVTGGITAFDGGAKDGTDTITVVLNELALLDSVAAQRSVAVADAVGPVLVEQMRRFGGGDVDVILLDERPCGYIEVTDA